MSPRVTGRVGRGNPAGAPAASPAAIALADSVTTDAIQEEARSLLGRVINADELAWVVEQFFQKFDTTLFLLLNRLPRSGSREQLLQRMASTAETLDGFASEHSERLDFESYLDLAEQAAALKAITNAISAANLELFVIDLLDRSDEQVASLRSQFEEGGAS